VRDNALIIHGAPEVEALAPHGAERHGAGQPAAEVLPGGVPCGVGDGEGLRAGGVVGVGDGDDGDAGGGVPGHGVGLAEEGSAVEILPFLGLGPGGDGLGAGGVVPDVVVDAAGEDHELVGGLDGAEDLGADGVAADAPEAVGGVGVGRCRAR